MNSLLDDTYKAMFYYMAINSFLNKEAMDVIIANGNSWADRYRSLEIFLDRRKTVGAITGVSI